MPTRYPTESPTSDNEAVTIDGTDYQLIDGNDITGNSIESITFGESGSYFNPVFKNTLFSSVEVRLNSESTVNLFELWINGTTLSSDSDLNLTMNID